MAGKSSVGKRIRTFREERNVDLETLSQNTGLTVNFLERMENDEIYPTIGPLQKVARSLGVRLGTLMDDDEEIGPVYIDADQMEEVQRLKSLQTASDAGDLSYFSLAAGRPSRHMNPFVITVDPSDETEHHLVGHEGEEWLFGVEGQIEIEYGKGNIFVLGPGESIYYDSIVPHQVRAHDGQKAKFLAVVYEPM